MEGLKKQTLLFVEDDRDIMRAYVGIFSGIYNIMVSVSGQEAVDTMKHAENIDLVVLDYRLADMSGLEVLKKCKDYQPSVPMILVTAHGDENVAVSAFRYGVRDYLRKPFSFKELKGRIEFCLSLKQADKMCRKSVFHEDTKYPAMTPLHGGAAGRLNIQKALHFIDENFMTRISCETAADKACLSRYHFSREFKRATGFTYQKYILLRRIEKAKELLLDPRRTVSEIAHAVGYSDISNLIRNFRNITDQTPAEYRSQHMRLPK
jgi:YesN/AraC family two-component response regulator